MAAVLLIVVLVRLIERKPTTHGGAAQLVKVAQASRGDMPVTLAELGTVTPIATAAVERLSDRGRLQGRPRCGEGEFLAQIDPRQYQTDLQQAQAALLKDQSALDQTRSDLARYQELRAQMAIAEQTVTDGEFLVKQDEAQVTSDAANIAQFKLDLMYCHITARLCRRCRQSRRGCLRRCCSAAPTSPPQSAT